MDTTIELNGEIHAVASGTTVHELLASLELADKPGVGVECNGEFVERDSYATRVLNAGDSVQVIRFLGGG